MSNSKQFNTPILFLIFNRPHLTKRVFKRIREIEPKHLFIAADGPREDHRYDKYKCEEARNAVVSNIDWNCEVKTLFRDKNLGCGLAVSQAITWFFRHVEEGIILEDDCYPSLQFFNFSEYLLGKFKNDENTMHVSGGCYLPRKYFNDSSYYFTKYPFSWGWATWQSAWDKFNYNIPNDVNYPRDMRSDEISYWDDIKIKIENNLIDTWAFRWSFSIWQSKGKCISSTKNLINNIGFENATHTTEKPFYYKEARFYEGIEKIHDNRVRDVHTKADRIVFKRYYLGKVSFHDKILGRFREWVTTISISG